MRVIPQYTYQGSTRIKTINNLCSSSGSVVRAVYSTVRLFCRQIYSDLHRDVCTAIVGLPIRRVRAFFSSIYLHLVLGPCCPSLAGDGAVFLAAPVD